MPGQLLAGTGQTCPDFSTTAMNATQRWQWCGWPSLTSLLQQQAVATAHPSSAAPTYCTQGLHTCNHTECVRLHPHVATQGAHVHVQLCVCVGGGARVGVAQWAGPVLPCPGGLTLLCAPPATCTTHLTGHACHVAVHQAVCPKEEAPCSMTCYMCQHPHQGRWLHHYAAMPHTWRPSHHRSDGNNTVDGYAALAATNRITLTILLVPAELGHWRRPHTHTYTTGLVNRQYTQHCAPWLTPTQIAVRGGA